MKTIKGRLLTVYLIINIFIIYFLSYLKFINVVDNLKIIYIYIFLLIVNIVTLIVNYRKNKYRLHTYDFFILLMVICGIISTIFAINVRVSLFGFINRNEGLFALCYYFSLFLLASIIPKEDKKLIVYTILLGGFLEAIYGLLQAHNVSFVKILHSEGNIWVTGFTKNINFYGTIVLINLCYSLGLYISSEKKNEDIIYLFLTGLFLVNLLYSNTTSCFVGFIFVFIISCIYMIKNKKILKLLLITIITVIVVIVMNNQGKTTLIKDIIKTKNETVEITKGNVNDYYGTRRVKLWRETLKIVPKNIINGVGIDNFYYGFGDRPLIIGHYNYDKAHNDYLQILVTQGLLCLIIYLLFYINIFILGFRKDIYYILPVIGYLIQIFFNISVIEIAPIFYVCLGLVVDRNDPEYIYNKYIKRILDIIFSILILVLLMPIIIIISIILKIDGGKIIYRQKRTGRKTKEFYILKFRTMKNNKITKIGSILRKTSLDEIPQFINVLKGEMSIIGPRPWIIDYYKKMNKQQRRRLEVRPGITGLAQIHGRNNLSIYEKIEYDLIYIDNITFVNDLIIFIKSIKCVFVDDNKIDMNLYIKNELKQLSRKNSK